MAIDKKTFEEVKNKALKYYETAGIVLTEKEKANIEIADFGFNDIYKVGIEVVSYVLTERCSAKEVVLFPHQTCPEHKHPPVSPENPGKEETFRCRWGEVYLYVEGDPTPNILATVPEDRKQFYTSMHQIVLKPGDQFLMTPNNRHWFQGGPDGAVISEFSTKNIDELDIFTDPEIKRMPEVVES